MKNKIIVLLLAIAVPLFTMAQEQISVFAFGTKGDVQYQPSPSANQQVLLDGTQLKKGAKLTLAENASVGIQFLQFCFIVSEPGTFSLQELISKNSANLMENDIANAFGEALAMSNHNYYATASLTSRLGLAGGTGDKPPKPKPKDGHGDKRFKIIRIQPLLDAQIIGPEILFEWKLDTFNKKVKKFILEISDANNTLLFTKKVKGYQFTLNAIDMGLEPGNSYKWKVSTRKRKKRNTANIAFDYIAHSQEEALILSALQRFAPFQNSDEVTRLLMAASLFEKRGFYSEAFTRYRTAANRFPSHLLAKKMYHSFLWRKDIVEPEE